ALRARARDHAVGAGRGAGVAQPDVGPAAHAGREVLVDLAVAVVVLAIAAVAARRLRAARHAALAVDAVVDQAVAVVVEAVADLRGRRARGRAALEAELIDGADQRAVAQALADADRARRALAREVLVDRD